MHVVIFIGSPRENGNTSTVASVLSRHLEEKGAECKSFHLYQHTIQPCIDCRKCKSDDMVCAQNDAMSLLYENMEWADVIIFGTPIYWFGPSAKTKLLIDRFRPYFANKKLYGKRAALILPAGSGADDCDMAIEQFKRVFKALGMDFINAITLQAYDEHDAKDKLKEHDYVRDLADRIMEEEVAN
ncbi:flavodoxin family protein [Carboxylicivirga sp. M1479]|uniref:flavodoxin family protein n=1 Tax=Carboxylicivirga sp. M1479 TaxID=2594476 RepID=UPI0011786F3D|nr:flavodoxin family protein [Carboxylicivirga sp. M1479]TRX72410.1 flavodoxin family protein [Carboxylicivirga sp. M1479]